MNSRKQMKRQFESLERRMMLAGNTVDGPNADLIYDRTSGTLTIDLTDLEDQKITGLNIENKANRFAVTSWEESEVKLFFPILDGMNGFGGLIDSESQEFERASLGQVLDENLFETAEDMADFLDQANYTAGNQSDFDLIIANLEATITDPSSGEPVDEALINQPLVISGTFFGVSEVTEVTIDLGGPEPTVLETDANGDFEFATSFTQPGGKTIAVSGNTSSVELPLNVLGAPNLDVSLASSTQALRNQNVFIGQEITLDWSVANNEDVDVETAWTASVVLKSASGDEIATIDTLNASALSGGASVNQSVRYTVPGVLAGAPTNGDYVLEIVADPTNQISESNEDDNVATIPIEFSPAPNLTAALSSSSPTQLDLLQAGQQLSLDWQVTNGSSEASPAWRTNISLKSDGEVVQNLASIAPTAPLAGNASAPRSASVTLPESIGGVRLEGDYTIEITVDDDGQIYEAQENDNTISIPIRVVALPNLRILGAPNVGETELTPGQEVTVSWFVRNESTQAVDSVWNASVVLQSSTGEALQTLAVVPRTEPVAGQGSAIQSATVTIPTDVNGEFLEGDFQLAVEVDSGATVTESDESDNTSATAVEIVGFPNLALVGLGNTSPASISEVELMPGQEVEIGWLVRNTSQRSVESSWNSTVVLSSGSLNETVAEVTQTETVSPNGFLVQSVTFNLPEDLTGADPSGEFVVDIAIDPTNTLSETNDNDNTTSLTIKIVAPPPEPPNLVPTLVSSDPGLDGDALAPGQTVSLNWSVENSSPTAVAAPWNSTVVLKSQSGDVLQTVANVTKFGPTVSGAPVAQSATFELPTELDGQPFVGDYTLEITVDPGGQIEEGNEDDNSLIFAFSVVQPTNPELLPGDANGDGEVGFLDFLALATNFGSTDAVFAQGDFDGNGSVNFLDFLIVANNFGNTAEPEPTPALPGDADGDGMVGFLDFLALARNFGSSNATLADGDFDGNGSVNFLDFLVIANNFGTSST